MSGQKLNDCGTGLFYVERKLEEPGIKDKKFPYCKQYSWRAAKSTSLIVGLKP